MIPILPRGKHVFNFNFSLPQSSLPCSFESRFCTIRYYVKVTLDIPYSSPPQGIKYFTIIGPHIDCMDSKYLVSGLGLIFDSSRCQVERSAVAAGWHSRRCSRRQHQNLMNQPKKTENKPKSITSPSDEKFKR